MSKAKTRRPTKVSDRIRLRDIVSGRPILWVFGVKGEQDVFIAVQSTDSQTEAIAKMRRFVARMTGETP